MLLVCALAVELGFLDLDHKTPRRGQRARTRWPLDGSGQLTPPCLGLPCQFFVRRPLSGWLAVLCVSAVVATGLKCPLACKLEMSALYKGGRIKSANRSVKSALSPAPLVPGSRPNAAQRAAKGGGLEAVGGVAGSCHF